MRWLIVSAEPDLRGYLRDCLEGLAPEVELIEAADGALALERLESGGVELVLADLGQPRMNGLELARALADSPIAVLLLSAELEPEEAAAAGAAVMSMPFTRRRLCRRAKELAAAGREASEPRPRPRLVAVGDP